MIEFFSVTKRYPGGQIGLDEVTLRIGRGQMVFLTGPSGAGKTTFLKLIYCEEIPTAGHILVNGRNVSSLPRGKVPFLRRTIGVVFQSFRLIPRKTVFENVCYLPRILGLGVKEQKKLAFDTLRQVGLAHRMNAFPQQLSGGEQQRVAIARALINQPEILLADEPTGNLDPDLSDEILRLLLEINRQGTTVILATHDRELIERIGRRVLTLENGQLVEDRDLAGGPEGTPTETDTEAEAAEAGFEEKAREAESTEEPTASLGEEAAESDPEIDPMEHGLVDSGTATPDDDSSDGQASSGEGGAKTGASDEPSMEESRS